MYPSSHLPFVLFFLLFFASFLSQSLGTECRDGGYSSSCIPSSSSQKSLSVLGLAFVGFRPFVSLRTSSGTLLLSFKEDPSDPLPTNYLLSFSQKNGIHGRALINNSTHSFSSLFPPLQTKDQKKEPPDKEDQALSLGYDDACLAALTLRETLQEILPLLSNYPPQIKENFFSWLKKNPLSSEITPLLLLDILSHFELNRPIPHSLYLHLSPPNPYPLGSTNHQIYLDHYHYGWTCDWTWSN